MRAGITFSGKEPRISVGPLEGVLMNLRGRTEHIVSKDPNDDTLATWFDFYIERADDSWKFSYRSNRIFSDESGKGVLDALVEKSNEAIRLGKSVDLSDELDALNSFEPFVFGGLFARMDERHNPLFGNGDRNQAVEEMREKLRSHLSWNEIGSDKHLRNFAFRIPSEIIWVDETTSEEQ